jgi:hypothetical protein
MKVGIMRADLDLTSLGPQEFMSSQGALIKAKLSRDLRSAE